MTKTDQDRNIDQERNIESTYKLAYAASKIDLWGETCKFVVGISGYK